MTEDLIEGLKDQIGNQIRDKTHILTDQFPDIFSMIGDTAKNEVKNSMRDGGLDTVMNLFSNRPNNTGANLLQSNINQGIVR